MRRSMTADPPEQAERGSPIHRARSVSLAAIAVVVLAAVAAQGLHLVADRRYGANAPICRVHTADNAVALSFDDGPDPRLTPAVLSTLAAGDASATFFVQGNHVAGNEAVLRSESDAGMEIANHTWSHPDLTVLDDDAAVGEIRRTQETLDRELGAGSVSALFRPPFGLITASQSERLRATGYSPIHWSIAVDHFVDELGMDAEEAASAIAAQVRPGDILLAHDGSYLDDRERRLALSAIALLLPQLRARGMSVVDVGRLLRLGTPVVARPRPWFWESGFECPDG
jgi:peptidoglycan/xylan/chitin deacetylase (PgdA/CDA1 family)